MDSYGDVGGGGFVAGGCDGCGCLSFCNAWFATFAVALCEQCKRAEKLISKANAKQFYLLTDRDLRKLGTLTKPNPQNAKWTPMQLYLQSQVEQVAQEKHGSIEQLEYVRQERLESRLEGRLRKRAHAAALAETEAGDGGGSETFGQFSSRPVPLVTEAQRRMRSRLEAEHGGTKGTDAPVAKPPSGQAPDDTNDSGPEVEEI